jgi:hypothetical protein
MFLHSIVTTMDELDGLDIQPLSYPGAAMTLFDTDEEAYEYFRRGAEKADYGIRKDVVAIRRVIRRRRSM